MHQKGECYEMIIQHNLIHIFEYIFRNIEAFSKSRTSRIQITAQVRIQKMLSYIYEHYTETVTLEDIARAANISRSEAGRCFNIYMGYSPIEALIQYRLQIVHKLLNETNLTLQEISVECGFNSVNYFSRQFRKTYGCAPEIIGLWVNSAYSWRMRASYIFVFFAFDDIILCNKFSV